MKVSAFLFFCVIASSIGFAATTPGEDIVAKLRLKSVEKAVDDFIQSVPPLSTIEAWVKENGAVYGNYCGIEKTDETFDSPCLGRLDCVCKAHDFSRSFRHYLTLDLALLESVLGKDGVPADKSMAYTAFLQNLSIKLFAAKIKDVDIAEAAKESNTLYAKDADKATKALDKVIDENEAVRKKIEEINVERIKFEEMRFESQQASDLVAKKRAVSTQPFSIVSGVFSVYYEQAVSSVFMPRIGISLLGAGLITDTYLGYGNNKDFSAFLSLGTKIFVLGQPLKSGLYFEPFVDIGYENVSIRSNPKLPNVRDAAFVPSLMLGVEKVFPMGIYVDLGVGGGYHIGIPISDNPSNVATNFAVPSVKVKVGFAW
jgi:hypothetical protein